MSNKIKAEDDLPPPYSPKPNSSSEQSVPVPLPEPAQPLQVVRPLPTPEKRTHKPVFTSVPKVWGSDNFKNIALKFAGDVLDRFSFNETDTYGEWNRCAISLLEKWFPGQNFDRYASYFKNDEGQTMYGYYVPESQNRVMLEMDMTYVKTGSVVHCVLCFVAFDDNTKKGK